MIEPLEKVINQCNGTRSNLFEENKQALAHTHHLFFKPLIKGRISLKKIGPQGVVMEEEDKTLMAWVLGI
jgi:hypothetical protein